MNWSDVGKTLEGIAGDALPLIGGILGGPLGSKAGSIVASALGVADTPDAVSQAIKTDPEAAVKLAQVEADKQKELAQIAADTIAKQAEARANVIESVNKTIRTEAVGASWLQRNAQPLCKLTSVCSIVAIYFVLPLTHTPVPTVPADAWIMLGAILGVAAWHDGVAKRNAISGTDTSALGGMIGKLTGDKK